MTDFLLVANRVWQMPTTRKRIRIIQLAKAARMARIQANRLGKYQRQEFYLTNSDLLQHPYFR